MSKRILIPLDGSPTAEQALPHALACVELLGPEAELVLLRVLEPVHSLDLGPELAEFQRTEAEEYLSRTAAELAARGCRVRTRLARPSRVDEVILTVVRDERADLLLLCSHGRSGLERWFLGSVCERILRHAAVPVLLVRAVKEAPDWHLAPLPGYRSLLIPLDGSEPSDSALRFAEVLPLRPRRIALVQADDIPVALGEALLGRETRQSYRREIENDLKERAARLPDMEVRCTARPGVAWEAVVAEAEESRPDLMVLATRGRRGLDRLTYGSVAERIARHASCPVLLLHPAFVRPRPPEEVKSC